MPQVRGSYGFEIDQSGALVDNEANLERIRRLFRDGQIIGNDWGPGNPGDFDHGSWHILCHLAGGSGALQTAEGHAWCGITHVRATDTYEGTLTWRRGAAVQTRSLKSDEGTATTRNAKCLGFIEGSSLGHIAARGVNDPDGAFNGWPRQMFDQQASSRRNGGTVWEQWSITRDIRPSSTIGTSVLRAWLTVVSRLGGRFIAAVARGRREHSHPRQLVALVRAGLLSADEAVWDVDPDPIPKPAQDLLHEATPDSCLAATEQLAFGDDRQRYFMFKRRIGRWSSSAQVKQDLQTM